MSREKSILIPIPSYGFDPSEVAIPWLHLRNAGFNISFATPNGSTGQADLRMLTGQDLGVLKSILMADHRAVQAYAELRDSPEFRNPILFEKINSQDFHGVFLPGGHDKGMREYLESKILQDVIVEFFEQKKPVGAICHGTLLVGRSISPHTGQSVLWGRMTTGLTKFQEKTAYYLTRTYLGDYYLTYPEISMEDELRSYLKNPNDFLRGPGWPIPMRRDSPNCLKNGFSVIDQNYISARWPGDAYRFSADFARLLSQDAEGI